MIAARQKSLTLAEFLEWEDRQEMRYEFDGSSRLRRPAGHLRMPPFKAISPFLLAADCAASRSSSSATP
jgi:hypothetical protein